MFSERYDEDQARKDDFYEFTIAQYQGEALNRFGMRVSKHVNKFAICVAHAFLQEEPEAIDIFDDIGLGELHAHALLEDKASFIEQWDWLEHERCMAQYE
jgi:hypothetical protein